MTLLTKVISGGQIGADIAGVRAAYDYEIPTGGYMPLGYRTLVGSLDSELVERYGFEELGSPGYPTRTEVNVKLSDATIRFAYDFNTAGEKCTMRYIRKYHKPYHDVHLYKPPYKGVFGGPRYEEHLIPILAIHLDRDNIKILNIAGNASISIEPFVEEFLGKLFTLLGHTKRA